MSPLSPDPAPVSGPPPSRRRRLALGVAAATVAGAGLLVSVAAPAQAANTTYYVDAAAGADSNSGLDQSHPWKSLGKINATTFGAGDRILLKAGSTWTGQLWPKGSGAAGAPIVVDSYGTGNKPRINGAGTVADTVRLFNQEYWTIRNIEVTNTAPSTGTAGGNLGDFRGIHISGDNSQTLDGFLVDAVNVHDVTGRVNWIGGDTADNKPGISFQTGWDSSKRTGGIVIDSWVPNPAAPPSTPTIINDAVVQNSTIANTSFAGIVVKQYTGSNAGAVATGWGTRANAGDTKFRPHTNIVLRNNYITQAGTAYGCNGIYMTDVRGGTIERNVVDRTGTSGIETYFADNVTIQYNEVFGTTQKAGGADHNGIDTDKGTTAQVVQYNYVHNNGDGILLCQFAFGNVVVRYNVITSNTRYQIYLHSDKAATAQIYNNTIYNDASSNLIYGYGDGLTATYAITNNILYSTRANAALSTSGTITYNRNLYGGATLPVPSGDTRAIVADPRFVSAPINAPSGTASTGPALAAALELQVAANSPAVNAGVSIGGNGGRDYAGNPLYNGAPDIGAFEQPGGTTTPVTTRHTFDALPTGPLANGTEGLAVSTAGGSVAVVDVPSATDKSVRLTRTTNSGSTSVSQTFGQPLTGLVTVETNVMRESAYVSGSDFFAIPYIRNASGQNAVSVAMTKNTIVAYSGTTQVTVGSYTPGRWYAVRVVISTATGTFDLYIDGVLKLDNSTFRNPLPGVAQIDYYANSSNYGSVVVDDITVTATA
ncbi:right-handed parallel beta-helix repeat-containing protein [Dactylosporangium aurantiacum]|uniref:Right-handed parallel beta-helix repeat-containing protein n=1 Tax=Dactylosporangium aurantiacum TaxID=35754 RepID=A0A9Q9IM94_9ACTN|nr:right-handed parallel beta-helix repeat-containing protein [Dactylosporangium aurantiacum]MDG6107648.1 right-handed parallel beta-helix repeat-containing protein [Dactylosporangium aurantiacum]UWZ58757.1 right-handed parallel beta-helix repeat-containing protein [Dactylosporangium aurantiacum]